MWDDTFAEIKPELDPQERLLWSGKPASGLIFRRSDATAIPISILWTAFAIFWETAVFKSNGPIIAKLWGIPFLLVGLYMMVGRFFFDAWQRGRTTYGLTNERVIIVSNSFNRSVKSLNLRMLTDITLEQKPDDTGTIIFGERNSWSNVGQWGDALQWGGKKRQPDPPSLELIEGATKVYDMIREAQTRSISASSFQVPPPPS